MQSFHSRRLWNEIRRLAKSTSYKLAAVAFATNDEVVAFGAGDLLVVDASDNAIRTGQTDCPMLKRAFRRGVALHHCPGLHAKVFVFDDTAVIGSANLTHHSLKLVEAGVITDNPSTVAAARSFVEQLAGQSHRIDLTFLNRIETIEVKRTGPISRTRRDTSTKERESRYWLTGLHPLDEDERFAERMAKWEREASLATDDAKPFWHFSISGRSRIRQHAEPGDFVIEIWREDPGSKIPDAVYRPRPIRDILEDGKRTCFLVEKRADAKKTRASWTQFLRHLKRIGFSGKVGRNSIRVVPPIMVDQLLKLWPTGSPQRRRNANRRL